MKADHNKNHRGVLTLRNKSFKTNQMWKSYWEDLKKQRNVDIQLSCEKKIIGAHKTVLFCASKCFETMITSQDSQKQLVIFFHRESYINVVLALKYIYTGKVKLNETRLPSFTTLLKSLELVENMEIHKPMPKLKRPRKGKQKEQPKKNPSPFSIASNLSIPDLAPATTDEYTIFSTSDDESEPETPSIFTSLQQRLAKRRNETPVESQQPSKRLRIEEYHCACCDFVCNSNSELDRHFITCPRGLPRNNELTHAFSFSSSDSSDL